MIRISNSRGTLLLTGLAIAALSGCASSGAIPTPEAQARDNARDEMVCEMVRPLGSRMPKKVCRSRADIERDASVTDDFFNVARDRVPEGPARRPGFFGGKRDAN